MSRTTTTAVKTLLGQNYDTVNNPSLAPYIDSAASLVDALASRLVTRRVTYTGATLELIERWLSCYFYTKMDPLYLSQSTAGAGGSYNRDVKNDYLVAATQLDTSGILTALLSQQTARMTWVGKTPSERRTWYERDSL